MNKFVYNVLSVLSVLFLTPVVTYLLTLGVSEFEGGRGYAFFYGLPVVFVILLAFWVLEKNVLPKSIGKYYRNRNIISLIIILMVSTWGIAQIVTENSERANAYRNSHNCQSQRAEAFRAYVYEISESHQTIRFKMADSTRRYFNYSFKTPQDVLKKGFIGQLVTKHADSTTMTFLSRSGAATVVKIPCDQ